MELENDYYLLNFQDDDDYSKLMVKGLRMTNYNIDNGTRDKFARMVVVYVYLRLPLVSKIKIGNDVHKIIWLVALLCNNSM
ncbi:hypothetical protein PVK06_006799 [Gossypium arboreum]|uniref:Uncharacterized protein n=1 Tax=Gossypium arboreum TaxID=29729 RepID=A0ABR0QGL2_GOSAR|nr:hypothetical protein PVK06_006799 [Gossypium arboreum]